jgi:hypothetical protein
VAKAETKSSKSGSLTKISLRRVVQQGNNRNETNTTQEIPTVGTLARRQLRETISNIGRPVVLTSQVGSGAPLDELPDAIEYFVRSAVLALLLDLEVNPSQRTIC